MFGIFCSHHQYIWVPSSNRNRFSPRFRSIHISIMIPLRNSHTLSSTEQRVSRPIPSSLLNRLEIWPSNLLNRGWAAARDFTIKLTWKQGDKQANLSTFESKLKINTIDLKSYLEN